jgi:hypothetical protein
VPRLIIRMWERPIGLDRPRTISFEAGGLIVRAVWGVVGAVTALMIS